MEKTLFITVVAFVVLGLGSNSYAASCNKRAEVHHLRVPSSPTDFRFGDDGDSGL